MYSQKIQWALKDCIVDTYFLPMQHEYHLLETRDSGKSDLAVTISSNNLCSSNFDDTNSKPLPFIRTDAKYGWNKRVDHLLFIETADGWELHLIEMKTTIGRNTWITIKQKVRSSYLIACSLANVLGISIKCTHIYTTFENTKFNSIKQTTNPSTVKVPLGRPVVDFEKDEWDKDLITVNLGEPTSFPHTRIQMVRKTTSSGSQLEGLLTIP